MRTWLFSFGSATALFRRPLSDYKSVNDLGSLTAADGIGYLEDLHPLCASAAGRKAAFRQP